MRILQLELGILNFMVAVMFVMVMHDSWKSFMDKRRFDKKFMENNRERIKR